MRPGVQKQAAEHGGRAAHPFLLNACHPHSLPFWPPWYSLARADDTRGFAFLEGRAGKGTGREVELEDQWCLVVSRDVSAMCCGGFWKCP